MRVQIPRIDIIVGRVDDMIKIKEANMFPMQFDEVLSTIEGTSCEYQVMTVHLMGRDEVTVYFETDRSESEKPAMEEEPVQKIMSRMNVTVRSIAVSTGYLPKSEKKTNRTFDNRY